MDLELVARAAAANPFSREREALDAALGEFGVGTSDPLAGFLIRLEERLQRVDASKVRPGGAREMAILFEAFHRFAARMDALIERQLAAGRTPVVADFAVDLLRRLVGRGIPEARAQRMLELFYQMRRAFFFVSRGLPGRSPSMRRLRESLWDAIFTRDLRTYERVLWTRMEDFPTLLLGETGTGKGAAAAALGRSGFLPYDAQRRVFSPSFTETFVTANLAELAPGVLESELFGHAKGAFTGAISAHRGLFERSGTHGAVFLDEIGDVAQDVQLKLLRVLQDRAFTPVGAHEPRRFAGRVIAATHRDLEARRASGAFRDDFYYRLCAVAIHLPPLRERLAEDPAELDDLLVAVLQRVTGEPSADLIEPIRAAIERDLGPRYPWPGNVRELEQCVRRILLTGRAPPRPAAGGATLAGELARGELTADALLARYCGELHARHGSYTEVARITHLDRRTVKRYLTEAARPRPEAPAAGAPPRRGRAAPPASRRRRARG